MTESTKKMSVMQLTVIVAVNMMGSGIIMLPANMAQVGAISLLSWIVTSIGSLAIAYGFAQAGIFNHRPGGLAAYAEDAYGKAGYFQVFFLYFLATAIANVAIAISALGYIAAFLPVLTSTPMATCIGVIALLWLTTVANFGGPKLTGQSARRPCGACCCRSGFIAFAGWFWFSSATFAAAWNPQGLSLAQGMGSSISLTLWAYLGMESAAQNCSAVENPERDVPLACMFGTLGAGVVYILSTTVIQGIVPNAELALSTGPFGLAFTHMIGPRTGRTGHGAGVDRLRRLAARLAIRAGADRQGCRRQSHVPAIFAPDQPHGGADRGHADHGRRAVAAGAVDDLAEAQRAVQHPRRPGGRHLPGAVYPGPLGAADDDAQCRRPSRRVYQRNVAVALIAMVYSIYSIYEAGKDAVLGGMLVLALGLVLFGLLAPRFPAPRRHARWRMDGAS